MIDLNARRKLYENSKLETMINGIKSAIEQNSAKKDAEYDAKFEKLASSLMESLAAKDQTKGQYTTDDYMKELKTISKKLDLQSLLLLQLFKSFSRLNKIGEILIKNLFRNKV